MDREKNDTYRLNWDNLKTEWPVWIVMAGLLLGAVLVYPHLPEQVPSHWNIQGEVDDYQGRFFGAFFFPLMIAGLYLLCWYCPLSILDGKTTRDFAAPIPSCAGGL